MRITRITNPDGITYLRPLLSPPPGVDPDQFVQMLRDAVTYNLPGIFAVMEWEAGKEGLPEVNGFAIAVNIPTQSIVNVLQHGGVMDRVMEFVMHWAESLGADKLLMEVPQGEVPIGWTVRSLVAEHEVEQTGRNGKPLVLQAGG